MDAADRAQKDIEMMDSLIKRSPEPVAKATGKCLWCGRRVKKGHRWCDASCRDDWEKANKGGK